MELLEFKNTTLCQDKRRYSLYFDKFRYRASVCFPGIHYFRYEKNTLEFNKRLEDIVSVWPTYISDKPKNSLNNYVVLSELLTSKYQSDLKIYESFVAWRNQYSTKIKVCIRRDHLDIYFDEPEPFRSFVQFCPDHRPDLRYIVVNPDLKRDVIYHINPTHQYRLFFKLHKMPKTELANFKAMFTQYDCKMSPGLKREIYSRKFHSHSGYLLILDQHFVDIQDDSLITVWALRYPNLVRKVVNIEKR